MRYKKAQVLIISLWILVILTMLAISIGHRVSMSLRLSRYQKNNLKALYLAKAALNLAISELRNDDRSYDALGEPWAGNKEEFEKIILNDNPDEFAVVSYVVKDSQGRGQEIRFGVIDEERMININTADQALLEVILENMGIPEIDMADIATLAYNIRAWRGDKKPPNIPPGEAKDYQGLGYICKEKKFTNVEELNLVKGITPEIYAKIKDLITIYGNGKVNINTASKEMLRILGLNAVNNLEVTTGRYISEDDVDALIEAIESFRGEGNYFNIDQIDIEYIKTSLGLGDIAVDNRTLIIDKLISLKLLSAVSENFMIEVAGNAGKIKRKIEAVYNCNMRKILYWHEG